MAAAEHGAACADGKLALIGWTKSRRLARISGPASFDDAFCGFAVQAHAVSLDDPTITNRAIGNVESRAALQTRHVAGLDGSIDARDEEEVLNNQSDGQACEISDIRELTQRVEALVQSYRNGTDDAPYFVAQDIARLPAPYAIAVTAAICKELDQYERPRFAALLLEVAHGRYRSVFDRE